MTNLSASVIIVTADRPAEVARCLKSFLPELPANSDTLVVDASGDDRTETTVRGFPGVRYVRSPRRNLCAQRNLGVRSSDKDVVAFLDDDAIADPGWLRELLAPYHDPAVASVAGGIREEGLPLVRPEQSLYQSALGPAQRIVNWQQPTMTEVVNGQGGNMSFRKSVLLQIGPWDEALRGGCWSGEDMDIYIRLRRAGGRVLYNPQAMVTHRPAATTGYKRGKNNRHYMFWAGRNVAYNNTKHFLGRKEFFHYFLINTARYPWRRLINFCRLVANHLAVTLYHLAGRARGLCEGLVWHWKRRGS